VIAVGSDGQWRACANALGLEALAENESLKTNAGRVANRELITGAIAKRVAEMGAHHWIGRLEAAGVPCGLVKTVAEALEGTNADARTGVPPSVPGTVRRAPPRLDEHGDAIRKLGWRAFE
jgi:crotonobetainyl-CoA:carnitine CoA-transferase CaiB-like acyl-CoA transferase